ncbi:MAG: hypothetical protein BWK79_11145 [Beggiatoa sp. IS2]|nr:MAG: hypothetical protein BWK79_11145 [Beggiatoa sp. IS2]
MTVTNKKIDEWLNMPKKVTKSPKKELVSRQGSLRNDFECESTDGNEKFRVFIRILEALQEDFSIGLDYIDKQGKSFCLIRCNGKHGLHRNHQPGAIPFDGFHIHLATEGAINNGESPEQFAEPTKEYTTWQDALSHFVKMTHIHDADKYFPFLRQPNLFS